MIYINYNKSYILYLVILPGVYFILAFIFVLDAIQLRLIKLNQTQKFKNIIYYVKFCLRMLTIVYLFGYFG